MGLDRLFVLLLFLVMGQLYYKQLHCQVAVYVAEAATTTPVQPTAGYPTSLCSPPAPGSREAFGRDTGAAFRTRSSGTSPWPSRELPGETMPRLIDPFGKARGWVRAGKQP